MLHFYNNPHPVYLLGHNDLSDPALHHHYDVNDSLPNHYLFDYTDRDEYFALPNGLSHGLQDFD